MKKHLCTLVLAGTLMMAGAAQADFYAGLGIGGSFNGGSVYKNNVKSHYKDSPVFSFSGGYQLPLPLLDIRGEVEYLRTRPHTKDSRTKQLDGLFLNAYGSIPFVPLIDPYVGLGIGRVRFDHKNSFAVQGMIGAEYSLPIAPVVLGTEYRYMKINENTGKVRAQSKYHTNILMLKARYIF